ncbi:MAG: hypothetical protein ACRDV3_15255 [Acidothermaceae bacterium]
MPFSAETSTPPPDRQCIAIKRNGERCKNWSLPGTVWCYSNKHGQRRKRKITASARAVVDAQFATIMATQGDLPLARDAARRRADLAARLDAALKGQAESKRPSD